MRDPGDMMAAVVGSLRDRTGHTLAEQVRSLEPLLREAYEQNG
jgi:hypothetical protein